MPQRTQEYIKKYCEYIDRLLFFWKNNGDKDAISRLVCKAKFIHHVLGIYKRIDRFGGQLINPNIGEFYHNLKDYKHDPSYTKKIKEQTALREKHTLECKVVAKKTDKIDAIESGAYEKEPITNDKLNDLLFSLKQIRKDINARTVIDESEGQAANNLAIEMGLVSKWLPLAIETRLAKGAKLPYPESQSFPNTLSDGCKAPYPQSVKDNIEKWISKIEKLINNVAEKNDSFEIPPEHKSPPVTLSKLSDYWGGDMTPFKLRGILKNNRLRYNKLNRQTYEFDLRDLPKQAVQKLKQ